MEKIFNPFDEENILNAQKEQDNYINAIAGTMDAKVEEAKQNNCPRFTLEEVYNNPELLGV